MWKQRGLGTLPAFALEETRLAAGAVVAAAFRGSTGTSIFDWAHLHDNFDNLREFFWSARLLQSPRRRRPRRGTSLVPIAGLLATWFGTFLVIKGTTRCRRSLGQFLPPPHAGFPAFFLLGVSIVLLVPTVGVYLRSWPEQPAGRSTAGW